MRQVAATMCLRLIEEAGYHCAITKPNTLMSRDYIDSVDRSGLVAVNI